ncbi:PAS domain S-box protein [Geobacter sp. DSM 9736]|uniref:PAS domain S-box protein n=1 Tax=Geobacter sp. DSM 9736 TaxID=1277350 RepID=UPI000B50DA48|nr:PAS domain S-box protein [Geobacter sp. DSM 9736]SNB46776.1 PAS domain S-box-containing protein/diguanylate cyclase (GGDEF) domain-containing protein [Geobacter sp. DSM 9736]
MSAPLRVLLVEDSPDDAELLLRELRKGGFAAVCERVESAEAMASALERESWDLVIADYILPRFTGLAALELMRKKGIDLPFIIVSGKVGEDAAVKAMKAGAHDYFVKGHLARLAPAITRELSEHRNRLDRARATAELRSLKKAIETMPIGVTITDIEGVITYTNPSEAAMHGYSVPELLGTDVRRLAPPHTWKPMTAAQLKRRKSLSRESVNVRRDGSLFPVYLVSNVVTDADGEPVAIISTCEDISQRKQVEETLRKQLAAMESSIDGMVIVDEAGNIVYANQAHAGIHGYEEPPELIGKHWSMLYEPEESARIEREIMRILRKKGKWRGEAMGRRSDGSTFPQEVSLTVIDGGGVISVVRDISERKETEEKLRYMSTHDPLTGFYNRAYFEEEITRLQRSRLFPISVVMADVDGLKMTNDTGGHAAGDRLLQQAATVLSSVFRAEDMVARIGGDEFVVLLPEADEAAVAKAVQRVRDVLRTSSPVLGGINLSLSLGTATARESGGLLEALRLADERMYEDKLTRQSRLSLLKV